MSPLIREGVRLAREGDFSLLDCMELVERRHAESVDAVAASFIVRFGGRTLVGYCERSTDRYAHDSLECEACGGDGTLDARGDNGKRYSVECPECDGHGGRELDEDDDEEAAVEWRDLNGDPAGVVPLGKPYSCAVIYSTAAAAELIAKVKAALEALAEASA